MTMSDIAGYGANEFVSGGDDMLGLIAGLLGSGMSSPAGLYGNGPSFISGAGDPVSALLGMSDIAGADDMLGFSLNPLNWFKHKQKQQATHQALVKHAINQKLQQHGAAVTPRQNQKARRYPCPLPATVVAGGASATISTQPQALYRPERFVIAASLAPSFVVTDIKVGNVSQLPNTGDIPGELFAQNGVDCQVEFDTVNPAINLLVVVTNITGGALTFRGAFIGTNVQ
jgi:hypothetical protein